MYLGKEKSAVIWLIATMSYNRRSTLTASLLCFYKSWGNTQNWKLDCRFSPVCVAGLGPVPPGCGALGWEPPWDPHTKYPAGSWRNPPDGNKVGTSWFLTNFIRILQQNILRIAEFQYKQLTHNVVDFTVCFIWTALFIWCHLFQLLAETYGTMNHGYTPMLKPLQTLMAPAQIPHPHHSPAALFSLWEASCGCLQTPQQEQLPGQTSTDTAADCPGRGPCNTVIHKIGFILLQTE